MQSSQHWLLSHAPPFQDATLAAEMQAALSTDSVEALSVLVDGSLFRHFSSAAHLEVPWLRQMLTFFYMLSFSRASQQALHLSKEDTLEERCVRILTRYFNGALNDRSSTLARRTALVPVFNLLMTAYGALGHWRLAGNIVRAVTNQCQGKFEQLVCSADDGGWEQSRLHYWLARHHLSVGACGEADGHFARMHPAVLAAMQRTVHGFWSVCRLVTAHRLPNRALLQSLPAPFRDLFQRVQSGDIHGFRQCMRTHQRFWLQHQLYYVLASTVSHVVTRQLVRRVWLALSQRPQQYSLQAYSLPQDPPQQTPTHQEAVQSRPSMMSPGKIEDVAVSRIALSALVAAARLLNPASDIDSDDMECCVANAIAFELVLQDGTEGSLAGRGIALIRGYLSHERQTLVLSKRAPFP